MKTAAELITMLEAQITRLKKLKDESVGGFFFILPPDSEPIANLFLGDGPDKQAYYEYLASKVKEAQRTQSNNPYVGLPAGMR